jgi:hypothetical protein
MRMRRAQHHRIGLIRKIFVGGIAAGAADQPQILAAAQRLTDPGAGGGVFHPYSFFVIPDRREAGSSLREAPE